MVHVLNPDLIGFNTILTHVPVVTVVFIWDDSKPVKGRRKIIKIYWKLYKSNTKSTERRTKNAQL